MKAFIKNLIHSLGWEVHRRSPRAEPVRGPLVFGPYRIDTDNVALLSSYHEYPETNRVIYRLITHLAGEGPGAFIDIGSNCGDSTALAKWAAVNWPSLCIEGDPKLGAQLKRNLGKFTDVTLAEVYLGAKAESIAVTMAKEGWNNTLSQQTSGQTTTLALTTLDAVVTSWPHRDRVKLVKIDTEGYDVPILLGGCRFLQEVKPAVLFEYNREAMHEVDKDGWSCFVYLRKLGYETACFYDAFGRFILATSLEAESLIRDLHEYADGKLGKVYYYDIVCFHAEQRAVAERFVVAERAHRLSVGTR